MPQAIEAPSKPVSEPRNTVEDMIKALHPILRTEFPQLNDYSLVDIRFLWETEDGFRFRVNGHQETDNYILFSKFLTVWFTEKGLQYKAY